MTVLDAMETFSCKPLIPSSVLLCVVLSEFEPAGLVTFGPIEFEQLEGVDDR